MKKWTLEEIETLIATYPLGLDKCSEILGRSKRSLISKADRLNISRPIKITDKEIEYLKTNGDKMSIRSMSKHLKRSWTYVYRSLQRIGIINEFDNSKKWIPTEEETIILGSNIPLEKMVVKLNRSLPSIRKQLRILSLMEPVKKRAFNRYYVSRKQIIPSVPREVNGDDRIKEALMRIG